MLLHLQLTNQRFLTTNKITNARHKESYRKSSTMKGIMEEEFFKGSSTIGLTYHNPLGEDYTDTRTDCEATISGTGVENLEIVEVIKPIIYYSYQESDKVMKVIVQPAVVIVQSKNS